MVDLTVGTLGALAPLEQYRAPLESPFSVTQNLMNTGSTMHLENIFIHPKNYFRRR